MFSGVEIPSKSNEMIKLCEDFNFDSTIHDFFFKEAFQLALAKFDKHVNNNSAISIFNATRCFDYALFNYNHTITICYSIMI